MSPSSNAKKDRTRIVFNNKLLEVTISYLFSCALRQYSAAIFAVVSSDGLTDNEGTRRDFVNYINAIGRRDAVVLNQILRWADSTSEGNLEPVAKAEVCVYCKVQKPHSILLIDRMCMNPQLILGAEAARPYLLTICQFITNVDHLPNVDMSVLSSVAEHSQALSKYVCSFFFLQT